MTSPPNLHKCPPWTDCPICGAKATKPVPPSPELLAILAPSSAAPATASAPRAAPEGAPGEGASDESARLRAENRRLQAEVRDLYARLGEVHEERARLQELQRSLETLIVAGVAALEAVDRLGTRATPTATQPTAQSPSLLAWLRGVLATPRH